jgi:hypothetical protein
MVPAPANIGALPLQAVQGVLMGSDLQVRQHIPNQPKRQGFAVILCIALACNTAIAHAQDARQWRFNGTELLNALKGDFAPEISDPELRRQVSSARGQSYVAGVADSTDTKAWCGKGAVLPHELPDRVVTYLGDLPKERLEENAAVLVAEALAKSFPCGAP